MTLQSNQGRNECYQCWPLALSADTTVGDVRDSIVLLVACVAEAVVAVDESHGVSLLDGEHREEQLQQIHTNQTSCKA